MSYLLGPDGAPVTVWIVLELWSGETPSVDIDGIHADKARAERRADVLRARHEGIAELTVYVVGKFVAT